MADTFVDSRVDNVGSGVAALEAALPPDPADESNSVSRSAATDALLGVAGDAVAAAGAAGSVHAHVRAIQTDLGVSNAAKGTATGATESLFARLRYFIETLLDANGTGIGHSDDTARPTLVDASKSLFARLRFAFTAQAAYTKRERIQFGNTGITKTDATTHLSYPGGSGASATLLPGYLAPYAGSLSGLFVRMSDDSTTDSVFTVQVNDVDTALTCTIVGAGAVFAASDIVNTVAVAAGDKIGIKCVLGAEPAADHANVLAAVIYDRT